MHHGFHTNISSTNVLLRIARVAKVKPENSDFQQ